MSESIIANVGDFVVRRSINDVIGFAMGKGYEARRDKDERMAHYYWQIADHWKRVKTGDAAAF